ncbi:helix-turn-helix domain-containing protein [Streptomyces sp. NPDC021224]|uniref:helix-turn-helix domain-containing protein n=1 Tax=unclassified Streptomyces TaxID=2593676 RepID=UPI0037BA135B
MTPPRAVPPRVVPTELAALALGVPPATIRKWASRGKLTRYGRPGRAEYDLDELFALAEARTATTAGRGGGAEPQDPAAAESA